MRVRVSVYVCMCAGVCMRVRLWVCACVDTSYYLWISPAAAAAPRHAREVSSQAELPDFHFPGKLVDHNVPQSQITVHNLRGDHPDTA